MRRFLIIYFLLLFLSCWVSSCDIKKKLSRSKSQTQTSESNEASTSSSRQLSEEWSQIGSTLQHRDGMLAVQFDGPAVIDVRADGSVQFSGESPTVFGSLSSTTQDTTATSYSSSENSKKDSTGRAAKETIDTQSQTEKSKDQKTQKVWFILFFILLIIIAIRLRFRPKIP